MHTILVKLFLITLTFFVSTTALSANDSNSRQCSAVVASSRIGIVLPQANQLWQVRSRHKDLSVFTFLFDRLYSGRKEPIDASITYLAEAMGSTFKSMKTNVATLRRKRLLLPRANPGHQLESPHLSIALMGAQVYDTVLSELGLGHGNLLRYFTFEKSIWNQTMHSLPLNKSLQILSVLVDQENISFTEAVRRIQEISLPGNNLIKDHEFAYARKLINLGFIASVKADDGKSNLLTLTDAGQVFLYHLEEYVDFELDQPPSLELFTLD